MSADSTRKSQAELAEFVARAATKHGIPGVSVGVWADGRETFAGHGVTSIDNPLPVDEDTLGGRMFGRVPTASV
ncbi:serine hydrolase [Streptomyces sp. NPDC046324]|uniref:serine hydrolase n=1 Tax=Streptomyces sp. NPDC046324 TaxID=3154915 RepID=UPI0033D607E9